MNLQVALDNQMRLIQHDVFSANEVRSMLESLQDSLNDSPDDLNSKPFDLEIIKDKCIEEISKIIEDHDYEVELTIDGDNKIETEVVTHRVSSEVSVAIDEWFSELEEQLNNDRQIELIKK